MLSVYILCRVVSYACDCSRSNQLSLVPKTIILWLPNPLRFLIERRQHCINSAYMLKLSTEE